ncbi:CRISPR-associated endonuclease Cas1 [Brachybacterium sp. Marseille-Q7125]|uniref:CRISPR-associated endonuclease Cas1 n=1 Tax=Brachybacterium sp. Marseille-Q7125 TaxID=2932815 RepID=UPI001FF2E05F|nr:CRISPR-associated endonuclease Cas1 [Brachybacterium sp. Marseille-Q7125]
MSTAVTAGEVPVDSVPISLVAHHAFCPRRAWLEASGEKLPVDSFAMTSETVAHTRADDPQASTAATVRAMDVVSSRHGFHGRIDVAEVLEDSSMRLIEYKATPVRRHPETTEPMRRQLALQKLALEEMGHRVVECAVHFTTHHRRVPVEIDEGTTTAALADVEATRAVAEGSTAPPPLEDDPRCASCSHVSLCLPDERTMAETPRRISVPNPDSQVLHLATYGSLATVKSGRVVVKHRGEVTATVPLERVQAVVVHGNVDLSGGLTRELMWRRLPILWCSSGGRLVGWASSADRPNGPARVEQHVASKRGDLHLARAFIGAKVGNQATLLRRHGDSASAVAALRQLASAAGEAQSVTELFGVEGTAARLYFTEFPTMLAPSARAFGAEFPGRVGRGATDPLNVLLNYTYALLTGECVRALLACGLDPHAGFLHSSGRNKPALALDLMEEFRAPVADSVVLGAVNNGEIKRSGFADLAGAVRIGDAARKALIAAYERRLTTEFTHPVFGYRVTWRRAIEVQARMILGLLDGTQEKYVGVRVR